MDPARNRKRKMSLHMRTEGDVMVVRQDTPELDQRAVMVLSVEEQRALLTALTEAEELRAEKGKRAR
jgi:hypothetical protein